MEEIEEGQISQIVPSNDSSVSNGIMEYISKDDANIVENQSMLLERIASEINRWKFYISCAQNLPFIQNMEKNI